MAWLSSIRLILRIKRHKKPRLRGVLMFVGSGMHPEASYLRTILLTRGLDTRRLPAVSRRILTPVLHLRGPVTGEGAAPPAGECRAARRYRDPRSYVITHVVVPIDQRRRSPLRQDSLMPGLMRGKLWSPLSSPGQSVLRGPRIRRNVSAAINISSTDAKTALAAMSGINRCVVRQLT